MLKEKAGMRCYIQLGYQKKKNLKDQLHLQLVKYRPIK